MATWLERLLASRPMKKIAAEPDWRTIIDELERDALKNGVDPGDEPTVEYAIVPKGTEN